MEQPSHHPIIQEFFEWVGKNLAPGIIDPTSKEQFLFLPDHLLKAYFQDSQYYNLSRLLRAVFPDEREIPLEANFIAKHYSVAFCILLFINRAKYIHLFSQRERLQDSFLPFNPKYCPEGFPIEPSDKDDGEFLKRFCEQQWMFCAPILYYRNERRFEDNRILPITFIEQLHGGREGGSANLYKIVLDEHYNYLRSENGILPEGDIYANTYVLKTYYGRDAERYFENEVKAFRRLRNASSTNMIGYYGSFMQENRFNIILEYADQGSLEQYFKKVPPPTSPEDIIQFWEGMFMLLEALMRIHEHKGDTALDSSLPLLGWHQDVKPGNILVTSLSESIQSPYEYKFKLADLGISHFKSQVSSLEDSTDRDSQGTRTYGAPECCRTDKVLRGAKIEVKQNIDVFSLGAVYSEAAVWLVEHIGLNAHKDGLSQYRRDRRAATKHIPGLVDRDCFHDGENMLPVVGEWHKKLKTETRRHDTITGKVLDMVEEMLFDSSSRPNTITFWKKSQKILQEARSTLAEIQDTTGPITPPKANQHRYEFSTSSKSTSPTSTFSDATQPEHVGPSENRDRSFSGFGAPQAQDLRRGEARNQYDMGVYRSGSGRTNPLYGQMPHGSQNIADSEFNPSMPNRTNTHQTHHSTQSENLNQSRYLIYQDHTGDRSRPDPGFPRGQIRSMPPHRGATLDGDTFRDSYYDRGHNGGTRGGMNNYVQGQSYAPMEFAFRPPASASLPYAASHAQAGDRNIYELGQHPLRGTNEWPTTTHPSPPPIASFAPFLENSTQYPIRAAPAEPHFSSPQVNQWSPEEPSPSNNVPLAYGADLSRDTHRILNNGLHRNTSPPHTSGPPLASHTSALQSSPAAIPETTPVLKNEPPAKLPVATAMRWREDKKKGVNYALEGSWLMGELEQRDHVFIIDDTMSMIPYWNDMISVFGILAYIVKTADPDGIDLFFTMSTDKCHSKDSTTLVKTVRRRQPQGSSNISFRLDSILGKYKSDLRDQYGLRKSRSLWAPKNDVRPLNLYIFTDGAWQPRCDAASAIKNMVDLLVELKLESKQVGIQFISFGENQANLQRLEHLDDELGLPFDIVDTTPSNGNVWKMLLGAINPDFDESENLPVTPTPSQTVAGPSTSAGRR